MFLPHGQFLGKAIKGAEVSGLRWNTSVYEPHERLCRHTHETANFCLVLRGGFRDEQHDTHVRMLPGTAAFWAASVPHAQTFDAAGGACYNLAFPSNWLASYDARFDFARAHAIASPEVTVLCRRIYRECQHRDELSTLAIEGLALQLVAEFTRAQTQPAMRGTPRWVLRVVDMIEGGLSRRLTLETLAAEVDVAPNYLARAFRKALGMSIPDYIQKKRIERACDALLHSGVAISTIALRLGYFDQSHFTRVFRDATGFTPGAYRRAHQLGE